VSTVIGARFSDAERTQVEAAAGHLELTVSGFVRRAALQASAVVEKKAAVAPTTTRATAPERERLAVVLLDPDESSHAFVDGICKHCGVDGGDLPCVDRAASR
jgi:uncharacterized protein (DUF1778 family)